jgi:hypothetical protein
MNAEFDNKKRAVQHKRNKGPKDGQAKRGGSKYAKKQKGKAKPAPASVKRGEPVYNYLCICHGQQATKPPCERKSEDREERKYSESPLGTWRCSVTKRKCKVTRHKNKVEANEATA